MKCGECDGKHTTAFNRINRPSRMLSQIQQKQANTNFIRVAIMGRRAKNQQYCVQRFVEKDIVSVYLRTLMGDIFPDGKLEKSVSVYTINTINLRLHTF